MEPKIPIYCNYFQIFTFVPIAIFCQVVKTKQVGKMARNLSLAAQKIFLLPISWAGAWDLIRWERKIYLLLWFGKVIENNFMLLSRSWPQIYAGEIFREVCNLRGPTTILQLSKSGGKNMAWPHSNLLQAETAEMHLRGLQGAPILYVSVQKKFSKRQSDRREMIY